MSMPTEAHLVNRSAPQPSSIAIYARSSSPEKCDAQLKACTAFAATTLAEVRAEYADAGVPGLLPEGGPALRSMTAAIRAGGIGTVVVTALDRFSRHPQIVADLLDELRDLNVSVLTPEARPLGAPAGTIAAKQASARFPKGASLKGKVPSRTPYGYVRTGGPDGLALHPEREVTVREIFERLAAGEFTGAIARSLRVPPPSACGASDAGREVPADLAWTTGEINNIARRPIYRGLLLRGSKSQIPAALPLVRTEVPHLRIVGDEVWRQANLALDASARKRSRGGPVRIMPKERAPSRLPFGYVRIGGSGPLVDPKRAVTVAEIFRRLASGEFSGGIAGSLKCPSPSACRAIDGGRKIKSPSGWTTAMILSIAKNPTYRGRIGRDVEAEHLRIVTDEAWGEANRALVTARRIRKRGVAPSLSGKARLPTLPPFGYRRVSGPAALAPYPAEAEVVTTIFARLAAGEACAAIACSLPAMVTPDGAKAWSTEAIRELAKKPIYRGALVLGRQTKAARARIQPIDVEVPHLRIVRDELWRSAVKAIQKRYTKRARPGTS